MYTKKEVQMLDTISKILGITAKILLIGLLLISGGVIDILDLDIG